MKTQHTPGPWKVWSAGQVGNTGHYQFKVESNFGYSIASGIISCLGRTYPELEANAQLIAAAPDLLEACEQVMAWAKTPGKHGGNPYLLQFVVLAEAAIAKATGGAK